ncbi:MAG: nuclease-related domain-containing protein [Bacillota bacterium]
MIIKKREIPLIILKLQVLLSRLPTSHLKFPQIKDSHSKRLAGYKGEKSIDYQLTHLPEKDFFIFNDLRLEETNRYFQIDSLILTRCYIIQLEIKNIAGTLYFDSCFHQLIRHLDGKETVFQDPITQSLRHEEQIKKWLAKNQLPNIPVISLVVISNRNTLIRTSPHETGRLGNMVVTGNYLPMKIQQIHNEYKQYSLNEKECKKVIRLLRKEHVDLDQPILKSFDLNENDILKGVICPSCTFLPMVRIYGSWLCPKCHHKEKDAHILALNDYFLLFGSEMTNQKIRDFLCISSPALATRLLKSLNASSDGTTKDRVYNLSFNNTKM